MSNFHRCVRFAGLLLLLVGVLCRAAPASAQDARSPAPELDGPITVLDGDTIEISGRRYDIDGIDAPELDQTCLNEGRPWLCGVNAAFELKKILELGEIRCRRAEGPGKTPVVSCSSGTQDVAEMLLAAGEVVTVEGGSASYARHQERARAASLGLWRGAFVQPREWRAGCRAIDGHPRFHQACMIKGIREGGRRIFLLPTDEGYATTNLSRTGGGTMLCTIGEAEAHGWEHSASKPR